MNFSQYLKDCTGQLRDVSDTPHLDAQLLLAHALKKPRSFLYVKALDEIENSVIDLTEKLIKRRKKGEPIAYIFGEKEFWSLPFKVTKDTLVPRPQTELLVELVLSTFPKADTHHFREDENPDKKMKVADLGTGCGAIALAIAKARPSWKIIATDIDKNALTVATENSSRLGIENVDFYCGNWCKALPNTKFDLIVSNPPYICDSELHLTKGIDYEPKKALFSEKNGLHDIGVIIKQAKNYLCSKGYLLLEHGFFQGDLVAELLMEEGYEIITRVQGMTFGILPRHCCERGNPCTLRVA